MNEKKQKLSHSMVHYLLTIHKLKESKGYARVTDIAKDLNLTKGSVSTAVNNLKKRDLVKEEEDSKFLVLTDKGHEEVHKILSSRTLLFYFLRDFLGVSEAVAKKDSCLMEHLMSKETREKFFAFMKRFGNSENPTEYGEFKFRSDLVLTDFSTASELIGNQIESNYVGEDLNNDQN